MAGPAALVPGRPESKLQKLPKLFITGDFDGDHQLDTLYQHVFSTRTKMELDSFPSPVQYGWATTAKWLHEQQAEVRLALNKPGSPPLRLGIGQGLYCLLNLGDNNGDGKEEVAFVVDYCDESRVNSCQLITLCQQRWQTLKHFGVHEEAFDYTTATAPIFTEIPGFLLKKKGCWFYADYAQVVLAEQEGDAALRKLLIGRCN